MDDTGRLGYSKLQPTSQSLYLLLIPDQARFLLSSIGDQIEVKDENLIDMATAVSGSGPAVRCGNNLCNQIYERLILSASNLVL